MPYKCNVCGKLYQENSQELRDVMLKGNCSCGKRFLMYIRKDVNRPVRMEPSPEQIIMESKPSPYLPQKATVIPEVKKESEPVKDKLEWLGKDLVKLASKEDPIFLSIETIKILEEGKYQIDVTSLMGGKPVIVQDEDGVYYIDVPYAMKKKGD